MIVSVSRDERYCTELTNGRAVIFSDEAEDGGSCGERFSPHDLLCASLAACLNMTVRMVLEHKQLEFERVTVKTDLDRSDKEKTKFRMHIEIDGDIPEDVKRHVIQIASNCPVRRTLSKQIEFAGMENAALI